MVTLMLSLGLDPNESNKTGTTPLHLTCESYLDSIAELLLKHGASVNIVDEKGSPPIFYAARNGSKDICSLLVDHGADIKIRNKDGLTPYDIALDASQKVADLFLNQILIERQKFMKAILRSQ